MRGPSAWRGLLALLPHAERISLLVYAALSVGAAVSGSLSAVLLVPLVQPGHAVPFASPDLTINAAARRTTSGSAEFEAAIECLFGDAGARTLGFTPRGLSPGAGLALALYDATP